MVFVSYSSSDSRLAMELVAALESRGLKCWIAPRDIAPGSTWAESIMNAIAASNSMILLLSRHSNDSAQVIREVEHAVARRLPLIPVKIEDVLPSPAMAYFISTHQWLSLAQDGLDRTVQLLAAAIGQPESEGSTSSTEAAAPPAAPADQDGSSSGSCPYEIRTLLRELLESGGSELILTVGSHPCFRISGKLVKTGTDTLTPPVITQLLDPLMKDEQKSRLKSEKSVSFRFGIKGFARFTANLISQRGCTSALIAVMPMQATALTEYSIPDAYLQMLPHRRGIILVGGGTEGSTVEMLHSLVDHYNESFEMSVVTVENPITFVHNHKRGTIQQIEVGWDSTTLSEAVDNALAMNSDLMMIDDLIDVPALERVVDFASHRGMAVFSLGKRKASSCSSEWNLKEIIRLTTGIFSPARIAQVVHSIITLDTIWNEDGEKVRIVEITPIKGDLRAAIGQDRIDDISTAMIEGIPGSQTREMALADHAASGRISTDLAMTLANSPDDLMRLIDARREMR